MKLSEAMMLGDSLRERDGSCWYDPKNNCGCAMGGAALAIGEGGRWLLHVEFYRMWPWLSIENLNAISYRFLRVCAGTQTFEELVDYVRSIEPECGECNTYVCTCKKTVEPVVEEVTVDR